MGLSCHPLLPVSGTGTGFGPLPSRERGFGWLCCLVYPHIRRPSGLRIKSAMTVRCAGLGRCVASFCGYCLKASMTGLAVGLACFTLTLVLSHQGRGDSGGWFGLVSSASHAAPSGLRIKSAMTGRCTSIVKIYRIPSEHDSNINLRISVEKYSTIPCTKSIFDI